MSRRELRTRKFSDIESARIDWLLSGRIPLSEISLLGGMPGGGKTMWLCSLAALVSRGEFDNGTPSNVLFATAEDDAEKTLKPRLVAAGADLDRVQVLEAVNVDDDESAALTGSFRLPSDKQRLGEIVADVQPKLLIVDPLMAHLDTSINSWKDESAREAMTPLTLIAQEYGLAVVCALHLNKRSGEFDALMRFGGSLGGVIGPARSAFMWGEDTEDEEQRLLVHVKHNLSAKQPTQVYRIETEHVPVDRGGGTTETAKTVWVGDDPRGSEALLGGGKSRGDEDAYDDAVAFLIQELKDGPAEAARVKSNAKLNGVTDYMLKKAFKALSVRKDKQGFGADGRWIWALPMYVRINRRKPNGQEAT